MSKKTLQGVKISLNGLILVGYKLGNPTKILGKLLLRSSDPPRTSH